MLAYRIADARVQTLVSGHVLRTHNWRYISRRHARLGTAGLNDATTQPRQKIIPRLPTQRPTQLPMKMVRQDPYISTACFSLLESCGAASLRSEGPLALARLADDELRVPAVMALKNNDKVMRLRS